MSNAPPQPETITRLFDAVHSPFALLAGMELDLFTPLDGGPLSAQQIADAIGVQARKLRPLLYALVVAGLLTVEDDLFSNTLEASHYLVRGKPDYQGGKRSELISNNWAKLLKTAATIRAGGPVAELDYHSTHDELTTLIRGLYPDAVADAHRLMDRHDFSAYSALLDVGGGSGGLAITIAQASPGLKATVLDLPSVTPITRQIVAEANAGDRVDVVTADAVREKAPGSFDVVVVRHVLQVLSAEDARALLKNVAAVVRPGGVIIVVGWILDNSRLTPEATVGYNLVLLNESRDGQAYTEQEYFDWLDEAGFVAFERVALPKGGSMITARKTE